MLHSAIKKIPLYLILFFFLPGAAYTGTLELRIFADKLSLQADQVPLQDVLKNFSDHGIRVRIDPLINPLMSASFKNREVQEGLRSILKSLNHVLIWESIPGPGGALPLLVEIQIFRPGKKEKMQPLKQGSILSLDTDPKDGSFFVKNELLVKLKAGFGLAEFQKLLAQIGGRVTDYYTATRVYRIRLPDNTDVPALVERILNYPGIAGVEPNYAYPVFKPYQNPSPPDVSNFPQVSGSQGTVPVAIIDTGLMTGTGLERLILATLDTLQPGSPISDTQGHGTQMALIASGVVRPFGITDDSAHHTSLIPIRAFDDNGFTSGFWLMQGIEFAIQNGARVLSLSWGAETRSGFLEGALTDAVSRGLIIVASAGDEPTGRPVYPAAYPSVIGIGALGPDGKIWKQSNFGSFVSLYAPGFASLPVGYKGEPGSYAGTSIAAAFAANRIAEYISKHPDAGMQEIFNTLRSKTEPYQAVENHSF